MDYEKAYKDAINKIKSIIADKKKQGLTNCLFEGDLNEIFQELKMNEDERIRKEIIEFLQLPHRKFVGERNQEEWIEWLQKQNKQNSTPKFKVGDWVVFNNQHNSVYQIEKIENYEYTLRHIFGGSMPLPFSHENMIRAWTIKDAKDGDIVTVTMGSERIWIGIFKEHNGDAFRSHCFVNTEGIFRIIACNHGYGRAIHPATVEQYALLFSKMKEAGYEWDVNKKELNKIEKNPTWSEEDEKILNMTISFLSEYAAKGYENAVMCIDWLKSLKPQSHWKPTNRQLNVLQTAIKDYGICAEKNVLESLYNDLKNFEI